VPVPDLSNLDPAQALATLAELVPKTSIGHLSSAIGGLAGGIGKVVAERATALAADPPQAEAPAGRFGSEKGAQAPAGAPPGGSAGVAAPVAAVAGGGGGSGPMAAVPGPGVAAPAGGAPRLDLTGAADPAHLQQEHGRFTQDSEALRAAGQRDRELPAGEDQFAAEPPLTTVRVDFPVEAAHGESAGAVNGTAESQGGGPIGDVWGADFQVAIAEARATVEARKQEYATAEAAARADSEREIAEVRAAGEADKTAAQTEGDAAVAQARQDWGQQQEELAQQGDQEAAQAETDGEQQVEKARVQGDAAAEAEVQRGETEAAAARDAAERQAQQEQQRASNSSGGVLGAIADAASALLAQVRTAVAGILERGRQLAASVLERARRFASEKIAKARGLVINILSNIRARIAALRARLKAAFARLRDRIKNAIRNFISRTIAKIKAILQAIKERVKRALEAIKRKLRQLLEFIKRKLREAIEAVKRLIERLRRRPVVPPTPVPPTPTPPAAAIPPPFPSFAEIVAAGEVRSAVNGAWQNTLRAATPTSRREEGFWIRHNTGSGRFEMTATIIGPVIGPNQTGSVQLGSRPADVNSGLPGGVYSVGSFHTHTPTAFRPFSRAVGPSPDDGSADNSDDVVGVVVDYVESPAGSGKIPARHPLNSPERIYHSGPDRRRRR
jgi:hypothetical protein